LCDSLKYQIDDVTPGHALHMGEGIVGPPQIIVPLAVTSCVAIGSLTVASGR